jgi:uncharacterized protein (DUF433 family)
MVDVIEKYKQGSSMRELAIEYKCSQNKIKKYLVDNNITLRTRSQALSKNTCEQYRDEILQKYADSITIGRLTKEYNIPSHKIREFLKSNDVHVRTKEEEYITECEQQNINIQDIVRRYNEDGVPAKELSRIYNTSHTRIKTIFNKFGNGLKTTKEIRNSKWYNDKLSKTTTKIQDQTQIDDILEMYSNDVRCEDIAEKYNISIGSIMNLLNRVGVEKRCRKQVDKNAVAQREATMNEKYGVSYFMQDPKNIYKPYCMYSVEIEGIEYTNLQGFEKQGIIYLNECYNINYSEILAGRNEHIPTIKYVSTDKKQHYYFPDIYIPSQNMLIEIKCEYTFSTSKHITMLKHKACKEQGYKHKIIIFNNTGTEIIETIA